MSETRCLRLTLIWLRRLVPNLHRYDEMPKKCKSRPCISLMSISIGLVWSSHIRHPLYFEMSYEARSSFATDCFDTQLTKFINNQSKWIGIFLFHIWSGYCPWLFQNGTDGQRIRWRRKMFPFERIWSEISYCWVLHNWFTRRIEIFRLSKMLVFIQFFHINHSI